MSSSSTNNIMISVVLSIMMFNTCESIKCFECNSANNSACLYMHMAKMNAIVPVVDCEQSLPTGRGKDAFCRKITQTILHVDKTPEVRITRTCGWVKHKRECYKADNMDHLETVCQCFGDLCNGATSIENVKMTTLTALVTVVTIVKSWLGSF